MNKTDFLSGVSIFSQMKEEDLERIANQARPHAFKRGDVIITEGEQDHRLFVVVTVATDEGRMANICPAILSASAGRGDEARR